MMLKKGLDQNQEKYTLRIRLFLAVPLLYLLTSCSTTFIPGLDRVLFPNSSAKVGPLLTTDDEEVVSTANTESTLETANDAGSDSSTAEEVALEPEPVSEPEPPIEPEPAPAIDIQIEKSTPIVSPEPIEPTPPTIAVPAAKPEQPESSTTISATQESASLAVEYGSISGQVTLIGDKEKQLSAAGTMITLMQKEGVKTGQERAPKTLVIDMEDKVYQPGFSTISAGDTVVFVNKDNIRHNVFSSSGNNAFDLGTYGAGLKRAVTLDEPGIVKIYCNIHAEMATFIAVGNQGLSAQTDDQGRYQLNQVPPGSYEIIIWNIRGETKRLIDVKANETTRLVDSIDTTELTGEPHQNKFGQKYPKGSTLFEDEFY